MFRIFTFNGSKCMNSQHQRTFVEWQKTRGENPREKWNNFGVCLCCCGTHIWLSCDSHQRAINQPTNEGRKKVKQETAICAIVLQIISIVLVYVAARPKWARERERVSEMEIKWEEKMNVNRRRFECTKYDAGEEWRSFTWTHRKWDWIVLTVNESERATRTRLLCTRSLVDDKIE